MQLNTYIDHTILKPTCLISDIEKLCVEAVQYQFAAVCVPPPFVKIAKALTVNSNVKVATVVGFPFGYSAVEAKVAETILALVDGADEIDIVHNISAVKNNDWAYLETEIGHIVSIVHNKNAVLKVIIESGVLTDEEIVQCCELYAKHQVDYVKTSTGYAEKGATVEAVRLMRKSLPAAIKIKASGGIRDAAFAKQLVEAGADRLGCSASVSIVNSELSM